jgi:hypothetical protein
MAPFVVPDGVEDDQDTAAGKRAERVGQKPV